MPTWIVEPRDPLVARDGRPFDVAPGARAASLPFPFPSTTAGGARTRAGLGPDGRFDARLIPDVKRLSVRGPLLVELDDAGAVEHWAAPAPADALALEGERGEVSVRRLAPLAPPEGAATDSGGLAPVGMPEPDLRKPLADAPRFWRWAAFERWLVEPSDRTLGPNDVTPAPAADARMHVSIDPETGAAREGKLFQTSGLEFTGPDRRRLALALATDAREIRPGVAPLGGERRLVVWRESVAPPPGMPDELRDRIARRSACRVVLLTPAWFRGGHLPAWLIEPRGGVTPSLRAAAVGRPQVVSGWDFEHGRPKPTRRLAPAGSVYYLSLDGEPGAIGAWAEAVWMACVSDGEQERLDGFGLAVAGSWSGVMEPMGGQDAHIS